MFRETNRKVDNMNYKYNTVYGFIVNTFRDETYIKITEVVRAGHYIMTTIDIFDGTVVELIDKGVRGKQMLVKYKKYDVFMNPAGEMQITVE